MADYVSTLTGPQMDAALLDMAEHNSEAYAVGERNGIAVASDDVTYHNNARYYAQIASSQIVGDASSAVRWDTDQSEVLTDAQKAQARENIDAASDSDVVKITSQTLTSAEQAQARANIMAGGSNRNLLDNPWFTVNQRGLTTMSSASYAMDRWKCDNAVTNGMVYSDGVVTLASNTVFAQRIEPTLMEFLKGKTVTASLLKADGTVVSATNVVNSSGSTAFPYVGGIDLSPIRFRVVGGVAIKAVKLELGSVSTLANDVPPDYWEEYRKCRRYFKRLGPWQSGSPLIGRANSDTSAVFIVGDEPMAKMTGITATKTGAVYVRAGNNNNNSVTAVSVSTTVGGGVVLGCTTSGLIEYSSAIIVITADSHIDISADL